MRGWVRGEGGGGVEMARGREAEEENGSTTQECTPTGRLGKALLSITKKQTLELCHEEKHGKKLSRNLLSRTFR